MHNRGGNRTAQAGIRISGIEPTACLKGHGFLVTEKSSTAIPTHMHPTPLFLR